MPEEDHFFLKRARALGHALQPPPAQFGNVLALGLLLLAHNFAAFLFSGATEGLELFGALGIGFGPLRVQRVVRNFFVIYEIGDGFFRTEGGQLLNFGGRAAEAGAVEQVCGRGEVPFSLRQWLKHT